MGPAAWETRTLTTPAPTVPDRDTLRTLARRAADTLARSIEGKPDESPIETNAGSLRALGGVVAQLAAEVDHCAGPDCFGRAQDGIKSWVTRDRLDAETARAERYAAALRAIADAGQAGDGGLGMLVDWHSVALQLAGHARESLRDRG